MRVSPQCRCFRFIDEREDALKRVTPSFHRAAISATFLHRRISVESADDSAARWADDRGEADDAVYRAPSSVKHKLRFYWPHCQQRGAVEMHGFRLWCPSEILLHTARRPSQKRPLKLFIDSPPAPGEKLSRRSLYMSCLYE